MRLSFAQLNYTIGDLEGNLSKINAAITQAQQAHADVLVLSELAICGYSPMDLLNYPAFIEATEKAYLSLCPHLKELTLIIGAPVKSGLNKGKKLYNAAMVLTQNGVQHMVPKTLLPTYDVFDEYRYFEPGINTQTIEIKGKQIALTICEDLWNLEEPHLYGQTPLDEIFENQNCDLIVNLSASPFSYHQVEERRQRMQKNAAHYNCPLIYVNQVGAHTDLVFDGRSKVINSNGQTVYESPAFTTDFYTLETEELNKKPFIPPVKPTDKIEDIFNALVFGVANYFEKMGFKKAVLGSSGGIDSAVTLAIASAALGPKNVRAILLPSGYSSSSSISDAEALSKNLGTPTDTLPIEKLRKGVDQELAELFEGLAPNLTEENIQARLRGLLLMAVSNKFGELLLNTTNKSEMAVGYGTLYGDMNGALSVIGDVYKGQVYELAAYINRAKEIIPKNIIDKAPSAELRPDQKDSDSLPAYDILDDILFRYIEGTQNENQIIAAGHEAENVAKVLKLVNRSEFKRFQAAPVLRVSHKAFGRGRQIPLVAKYNF